MMLTDTVFGALKMIIDSNKRKIAGFNLINDLPDSRSENGTDTSTPFHYSQTSDAHTRQKLRDTVLPLSTGLADTEQRNERSFRLCSMTLPEAVELMIDEEARANQSLKNHVSDIVTLVEKITEAFRCGGRLIYVGAGTSGRLGILDASECPPTFKTPPHWVQGISQSVKCASLTVVLLQESSLVAPKRFSRLSKGLRTPSKKECLVSSRRTFVTVILLSVRCNTSGVIVLFIALISRNCRVW